MTNFIALLPNFLIAVRERCEFAILRNNYYFYYIFSMFSHFLWAQGVQIIHFYKSYNITSMYEDKSMLQIEQIFEHAAET